MCGSSRRINMYRVQMLHDCISSSSPLNLSIYPFCCCANSNLRTMVFVTFSERLNCVRSHLVHLPSKYEHLGFHDLNTTAFLFFEEGQVSRLSIYKTQSQTTTPNMLRKILRVSTTVGPQLTRRATRIY